MSETAPTRWDEVPGAVRAALARGLTKSAEGLPVISQLADVLGWRDGELNAHWGGPRPLTNLLVGSALGSLGGYGVGKAVDAVLPDRFFAPGAASRRGAVLGAVLGGLPGAYQAHSNLRDGGGLLDRWPYMTATPQDAQAAAAGPAAVFGGLAKQSAGLFDPVIERDEFARMVMNDPFAPPQLRAATAGLVEAAGAVRGGDWVSPWDVAKIAVGAGGGLVSGVIAGKALGALAGLTPEGMQGVQRIGLAAGILNAVVPRALGLRG